MPARKLNLVEYIEVENSSFVVVENIKCDELTLEMCSKYFAECKIDNDILGEYEDDIWKIKSSYTDTYINVEFSKELGIYKEKLKRFILMKMYKQNVSVDYIKRGTTYITKVIFDTWFFDEDYLDDYKKNLYLNLDEKRRSFYIVQFLKFINEGDCYIEFLDSIRVEQSQNRDIPGFASIILLDKIVDDVIRNHTELYSKYYYILLWWKISTIIPIRPSEFVLLKRNCIYEKHNEYYLHIERVKNKYKRKNYETPIMTEFQITKDIYEFIQGYIDYANKIDENEFLISRNVYEITLERCVKEINHRVNRTDFNSMLQRFYDNVVENIYGFEVVPLNQKTKENQIEKVRLGDTRHLAIINLMMQGINPLEIMKLAGHHSVETQMGYYSHVEKFMTSKTYVLSKILKNNSVINKDCTTYSSNDKRIEKDLLGTEFYNLPVVACGSGRCKSTNFPIECEASECIFCKHFLPEGNINNSYIYQLEQENQKNLELKKETLQFVLKNSMCVQNQEVERASKDYIAAMNQNVVIQSYRLRKEKIDQ